MDELQSLLTLRWEDIKNNPVEISKLSTCYLLEYKTNACCVEPVLEQYFINHKTKFLTKKKMKNAESSNYHIMDGIVIYLKSKNLDVTNANLTDELAREILEENPRARGNFDIIPNNNEVGETKVKSKSKVKQEENNDGNDFGKATGEEDISTLSKADIHVILRDMGIQDEEFVKLNKEKLIAFLTEKRK